MIPTPPGDSTSRRVADEFASAWDAAPPAPDLSSFLTDAVRADDGLLLELIRIDASRRLHRGEPVRLEHYARAIAPAGAAPGTAVARLVLCFERLAGISCDDVRKRLGDAYSADIDAVFAADAPMPSTRIDADSDAPSSVSDASSSTPGWSKDDRIGPYTLRKRLGEGAFGEVWLAERKAPDLLVSIKVLKPGATDDDSVRRFEAETQALAFLEHQYIAKIHEAGTARRAPYIAMEYVEGKPLTRYCDDRRLSIEQRLELMARICEGMQHAHQRGLIHRDLKPDNIFVTEIVRHPMEVDESERRLVVGERGGNLVVAVPKILDFGLAKAAEKTVRLADGTTTIDLGKMMGTSEYMAPEQAGHQPNEVTQKADIFSLGVILYELLSGTLPLARQELRDRALPDLVETLRNAPRPEPLVRFGQIGDEDARAVSYRRGEIAVKELARRLRGRVRHLCGKALRLEPDRRFSSLAAFGRDIRNYLEDRDFVEAAAEPRRDRILRNIRNNKLPYAAASAVLLALVVGIIGTTVQWRRAELQERRATAERDRSALVTTFIKDLLKGVDPENAGGMVTARHLLKAAEQRLNETPELRDDPETRAEIGEAIASALRNLDLSYFALPHLEAALEHRRMHRAEAPDKYIHALLEVARAQQDVGRSDIAAKNYREVVSLLEGSTGLDDRAQLLRARRELARVLPDLGLVGMSRRMLEEVLAQQRQLHGNENEEVRKTLSALAFTFERCDEFDEAKEVLAQQIALQEAAIAAARKPRIASNGTDSNPLGDEYRSLSIQLGRLIRRKAYQHSQLNQHDDADELLVRARDVLDGLQLPASHPAWLEHKIWALNAKHRRLKMTSGLQGDALREALRPILEENRGLIKEYEEAYGGDSEATLIALGNMATIVADTEGPRAGVEMLTDWYARAGTLLGPNHFNVLRAMKNLSVHYSDLEEFKKSLEIVADARQRALGVSPLHPELSGLTVQYFSVLAEAAGTDLKKQLEAREGELAAWRAQVEAKRSQDEAGVGEPPPARIAVVQRLAAEVLTKLGRTEEAQELLVMALSEQRKHLGEDHSDTTASRRALAGVLHRRQLTRP